MIMGNKRNITDHHFHSIKDLVKFDINTTEHLSDILKLAIMTENQSKDFMSPKEQAHSLVWNCRDEYPSFNYVTNELGFRDATILPNEQMSAAFGCSVTQGEGIPVETRWSDILTYRIGHKFYNFGQPGSSIQHMHDVFRVLTSHLTFENCVFLFPPYSRFYCVHETLSADKICAFRNINPHLVPDPIGQVNYKEFYKSMPDAHLAYIMKNAIYEIDRICKERNINAFYSSWEPETYDLLSSMKLVGTKLKRFDSIGPKARDDGHPGILSHREWVNINMTLLRKNDK